jgi:CcmD family protein
VTSGEKYVAAVYGVVFLFVLAYVLIMATKLARLQREVGELARLVRSRTEIEAKAPEQKEVAVG